MEFAVKQFDKQTFQNITCLKQDLRDKEFSDCVFKKCDFSQSDFSSSTFIDCAFLNCNLSNVKVNGVGFQSVNFENSKLLGIIFSKINSLLVDWRFEKCNIMLCDFGGLKIKNSKFINCAIKETDFVDTNLTGSDFSNSDLTKSKFQNTNLEKANFVGAKNYYIDPTCNKLKGAKFSHPDVLALLDPFGIKIEY